MTEKRSPEVRTWFFTFGSGHALGGESLGQRYITLYGTSPEARTLMHELFGRMWSHQYRTADDAGVSRWGLTEIKRSEVIARKQAGERVTSECSEAEGD